MTETENQYREKDLKPGLYKFPAAAKDFEKMQGDDLQKELERHGFHTGRGLVWLGHQ